jgi:UDP-N-acetylmuramoyl-L-alanyl-D-glutamate--2,6-diaminopimelate ligase
MRIDEFFKRFPEVKIQGDSKRDFETISCDSRLIGSSYLFVALKGEETDGHSYIPQAIQNGAVAILCESIPEGKYPGVSWIQCRDTKILFPQIVKNFYSDPGSQLKVIGITGTNGKTTIAYLVEHLLRLKGESLLVGTVEYRLKGNRFPSINTTPSILEVTSLMREAVNEGLEFAVLEASSHALKQGRLSDLRFDTAVFTNLTQDHLDYHGTFEDYFNSKKILFTDHSPKNSILNQDDPYGAELIKDLKAKKKKVISFSIKNAADSWACDIQTDLNGTSFTWHYGGKQFSVHSKLVCKHSASNIVAALTVAVLQGIEPQEVVKALSNFEGVSGRMERVGKDLSFPVFVDYAHTPDAVLNVLSSLREIHPKREGKILTVFGCGGDRDRTKRPLMAEAAQEYSDLLFVTSDNPRTEDPEKILDDITEGLTCNYDRITDRKKAIETALEKAETGDVVVILGKGHEDYQIIGKEKIHFSDQEVVNNWARVTSPETRVT